MADVADPEARADRGEIRVCPNDGEPVVFTFEFRGAEYHCVACAWLGGILGVPSAPATFARIARRDELLERYEVERAERTGHPRREPPQDVPRPTCAGCGAAAVGRLDSAGKPPHWYGRTRDGAEAFVCSIGCIPDGEGSLPW